MLSRWWSNKTGNSGEENIEKLKKTLDEAKTVLIGAGSGLSTSAGFVYTGERFQTYFSDFEERYGFHDMYSGGFYPYDTLEEHWAYWSRYIWINRYMNAPKPVYGELLDLVKDKDYFVLTTNVDHCFQKAGFDKQRLFYTQGDYGLLQCSKPCHPENYENEKVVRKMVKAQGFEITENGEMILPNGTAPKRQVPEELVPHCPKCGKPMTMNLRADDTFVQDEGWHRAAERYAEFLRRHQKGKILFLELGVGFNTPGIIKYPFWQKTKQNPKAIYACVNYGEAAAPEPIAGQAICVEGDIGEILKQIKKRRG